MAMLNGGMGALIRLAEHRDDRWRSRTAAVLDPE
jgi:hypothetical protein